MGHAVGTDSGGDMIARPLTSLARWIRAAYPAWASERGHVALIALCGRPGPMAEQIPEPTN
jgi:hypothetical protein